MIEITLDKSGLDRTATRLASAPSRIEQRINGRTIQAQRELLRVVRSVVHVRTGRLRDSFHIEGAHLVGNGTLEGAIVPSVPYARNERDRGGEHDYVAQAEEASQGIIDDLARDIAAIYVQATGAGAS